MSAVWSRCEICQIKILDTGDDPKTHERCSEHEDTEKLTFVGQLNLFKPEDIKPEAV